MNKYKYHLKETYKLAYPVTIGQLGHIMLGVVDSIMVGKVGATPLAAASLVNGLVFLIVVFGLGITLAITPLVAIAKGQENKEQIGIILRQALLINSIVALVLSVIVYFLADIIPSLDQPRDVAVQAVSYMKILSYSVIPFMIFQSYRQFIEGLYFTKPAMYILISTNIINAIGNWIFIYGNLGVKPYGLDGAGYATLFSRIFMAATIILFTIFSPHFKKYDISLKYRNINWKVIKKITYIGVPSGLQHVLEVGAFAFSAIMIGWVGSKELAAHQIALSMASISFMIILGISAAGTIRVGNALGREKRKEVRDAGFSAIMLAATIMACFGIIFITFRNFLPHIYISDINVIPIAASLLVIAAFFQISDGVQAVGLGVLRGITDVKIPMFITFIAYWIIGIPVGYLLGFKFNFGVVGIWIGLLIGLTIAAIFFSLRFHLKTKIV